MKLTIFVPIFGYLILFNEQVAQLFEVSAQVVDFSGKSDSLGLEESISKDTKTRLYYFYFGFSFLGIGSLIYQMFCPSLIKDYSSEREYIREEVGLVTEKRLRLMTAYLEQEELVSPLDIDEALKKLQKCQ